MNKFLWNTSLFLTKFGLKQSMKLLIDNFLNTLIKRQRGCKHDICSLRRKNIPARVWQVHRLNLN